MKFFVKRALWVAMFFLMATMPVVRSIDTGLGLHQYASHKAALAGDFWFPNPWKYRIFSTWMVEQSYQVYLRTVDKVIPIDGIMKVLDVNSSKHFAVTADLKRFSENGQAITTPEYFVQKESAGRSSWEVTKEFHRYFVVFILVRSLIGLLILAAAFCFFRIFISNQWMVLLGLVFLDNGMNNAFRDTAFGFDTYVDLLLFLTAIVIIIKRYAPAFLIPIVAIGMLNRETAILIPMLYLIINFVRNGNRPNIPMTLWAGGLGVLAVGIFFGLREYFGYEPYIVPSGWFRVVENFTNYSVISGEFAIMLIFPFLSIMFLKRTDIILRTIWLALIPIWFAVHYWSFAVLESRYFLVPFSLAMLPVVLYEIEKSYLNGQRSGNI
ncbi:hypothetical protein [Dyadobacter pollutisoli]|uniref:Uncharacterized protein n=1 Tax=Dyadobacter pollutisoli TaxID=2910158 RepID=A0A9E8SMA8_9BACT|nr:hypothetical protein [Dyadobacter pollutisoli]WAC14550.1 hypothetical protein ON006_11440 [Dyadobacter pollutisoli]